MKLSMLNFELSTFNNVEQEFWGNEHVLDEDDSWLFTLHLATSDAAAYPSPEGEATLAVLRWRQV